MDIIFLNSSIEDDVACIISLLKLGSEHTRVKKYICECFALPKDIYAEDNHILEDLIKKVVTNEKIENKDLIERKISESQNLWNENCKNINRILADIFQCKNNDDLINAVLSVNCVCPYDFEKRIIYINYRKNVLEIQETCVHELIHYYWFNKWKQLFNDTYEENLVWSFSEIAIDAIFKETELRQYCVSKFPAHKHRYEIKYNGQNMMEYFRTLYRKKSITEFMKRGIEIIKEIEREEKI